MRLGAGDEEPRRSAKWALWQSRPHVTVPRPAGKGSATA